MNLKVWLAVCVVLAARGSCYEDTDLHGIAYIHQTVQDLNQALSFYTNIMGGVRLDSFSRHGVHGDSHYFQMFQKEIIQAREHNDSPANYGVPDISDTGDKVVNWEFVLFDNCLVWLIQFTDRYGNAYVQRDPRVGSAKTGFGHAAFWVEQDMNVTQTITDIFNEEASLGYAARGFTAMTPQTSFAKRNNNFLGNQTNYIGSVDDGVRTAVSRGTAGEKLEYSFRTGTGLTSQWSSFCEIQAAHPSMLNIDAYKERTKNVQEKENIRTYGFHHVSVTVTNASESASFYGDLVLKGKQAYSSGPFQFPPAQREALVQDDYLSADEARLSRDEDFGFVDLQSGNRSSGSLIVGSITFDNFFLELYEWIPPNPSRAADLRRTWSSPAYTNVMSPGFWVKSSIRMSDFIKEAESNADAGGWSTAKANRAVDVSSLGDAVADADYVHPMTSGSLAGFYYTFAKGPSDEQISYASFTGESERVLKEYMTYYGAVTTAFNEQNPYKDGGFNDACFEAIGVTFPPNNGKSYTSNKPSHRPGQRPGLGDTGFGRGAFHHVAEPRDKRNH